MLQLLELPEDVLRSILVYASFSLKEDVCYKLVFAGSSCWLLLIGLCPREHLALLDIDLLDPLFDGFAAKFPFWDDMDVNKCLVAKTRHFSDIMASQPASHDQLDRLFGHLIENRRLFRKLSIGPQSESFDQNCEKLAPLQSNLIARVINTCTSESFAYKFLYLCEVRNFRRGENGRTTVRKGISYYYAKHAKFMAQIECFGCSMNLKDRLDLLTRKLLFSEELMDRLRRASLFLRASKYLDFLVNFGVFCGVFHRLWLVGAGSQLSCGGETDYDCSCI